MVYGHRHFNRILWFKKKTKKRLIKLLTCGHGQTEVAPGKCSEDIVLCAASFFFFFFLNSHQSNLNADFVVAGFVLSDIFNVPLILHSTLYAPGKTPSRKLCEAAWQRSAAIYP